MRKERRTESRLKPQLDTIIFDFDGTLFRTEDGIIDSLLYSIERNGLPKKSRKELRKMIGVPLQHVYGKMAKGDAELVRKCIIDHRRFYRKIVFSRTSIYPAVRNTLSLLKKRKINIAVASTKPLFFVKKILRHYKMSRVFHVVIGSPSGKGRGEIPKEQILDKVIRKVKFKKAAYVGDRKYDILAGKHHGLATIGVTYGIGGREELRKAGADFLIDRFEKIMNLI